MYLFAPKCAMHKRYDGAADYAVPRKTSMNDIALILAGISICGRISQCVAAQLVVSIALPKT